MDMNSLLKKRFFFFVISTFFVMILTIASSYAFSKSELNSENLVIRSNNLKVIFDDDNNLEDKKLEYPKNNDELSSSSKMKIINNGDDTTAFILKVKIKDKNANNLSWDKIYYDINGENQRLLSETEGILFTDELKPGEEYILNVNLYPAWESIDNDDQGKIISLTYEITEK